MPSCKEGNIIKRENDIKRNRKEADIIAKYKACIARYNRLELPIPDMQKIAKQVRVRYNFLRAILDRNGITYKVGSRGGKYNMTTCVEISV